MLSKRVLVLFDPTEYKALKDIALKEKKSVGKLIRESVRKVFLEDKKINFKKHPSFGLWSKDTRSDDEILEEIGGRWEQFPLGGWGEE